MPSDHEEVNIFFSLVVTNPGQKEVRRIPSGLSSMAKLADAMFRAVFEHRYAYMPVEN